MILLTPSSSVARAHLSSKRLGARPPSMPAPWQPAHRSVNNMAIALPRPPRPGTGVTGAGAAGGVAVIGFCPGASGACGTNAWAVSTVPRKMARPAMVLIDDDIMVSSYCRSLANPAGARDGCQLHRVYDTPATRVTQTQQGQSIEGCADIV